MSKHKNRRDPIPATTNDTAFSSAFKPKSDPYFSEEKSFTTRSGGPDVATLMGEYINRYAIGTGASLLMVHPIPANNSFLFIWENP